jgi:DNA replication and repair protein RecF
MHNIFLQKLQLTNYRNFKNFEISVGNNPVILIGENGSGKTNILEAISLFSPGKGLRSARLDEICHNESDYGAVNVLLQSKVGPAEISTKLGREAGRRYTEFNGAKIQNNELTKFSTIIWLTPQMDGLFSAGIGERRKFFDRIVYNFIPSHAITVGKYEHYMQERSRALLQDYPDTNWLKVIEEKMAELSIEITINRLGIIEKMQQAIDYLDNDFPKAILSLGGLVENRMVQDSKTEICYFIAKELLATRNRDKISNRTNFGVHRSDFVVTHKEKNIMAKLCSTGEQKSMLIALILAQVNYAIKENISSPILLLDEVFVHLDNKRQQYLADYLLSVGLQTWITGTDSSAIGPLEHKAELIRL